MCKKIDEIAETIDLDESITAGNTVNVKSRFPVEVDTRFKFIRQLGRGGMGMVYQAYDDMLQRNVALKFLNNKSAENLPLLVSEARAQAKLSHKYLCPIYEVLESEQSVYIAMQYIEGGNLQEFSNTLSQEQNLLLIMQCAQALEAAHREGMVHRDFKPLNVMIKPSDDGFEPIIVDFGLACSTTSFDDQPRVVSLRFTAPEQMSRKKVPIDKRTDIYSLGATLYYCLLRESPPQLDENTPDLPTDKPQWQALPTDIQLIIQKCMQVDASQRYANAAQVAKDIQSYLNGEPISVHTGFLYRSVTHIKKHKWLALALSAVVLVICIAIINVKYEEHLQKQREAALVKFNNQIKELEYNAQLTFMSPRHDITTQRQHWLEQALRIEQELDNINPIIRGTAQYAIGRIYLVVGDFYKALQHLKEADQLERSSLTAFYLAIAYTERYKQEVEKLRGIKDEQVRKARIAVADATYKHPALSLLSSHIASAPHPEYAQALLAYLQDDFDEVLRVLDAATNLKPWFYQDELLKGDIALSLASDLFNQGKPVEQVLAQVAFAKANYIAASHIAPSDPDVAIKPFMSDLFELRVHTQAGIPWESQALLTLQADYETLATMDRNSPQFHRMYGKMAHFYGIHLNYTDGDPKVWFDLAERELIKANQKLTEDNQLWMDLAQVYSSMSSYLSDHNLPAREVTQKAVDALNKVPAALRDYYYFNELGTLYRFRGQQKKADGEVSLPLFEKAVAAYLEAYERNPEFVGSLINAASTLKDGATVENYAQYHDALTRGKSFLLTAKSKDRSSFGTNYYLTVFDVEAVMLALYYEKPVNDLLVIAEQQLKELLAINKTHPYILDLTLRLRQFILESRFLPTQQWIAELDEVLASRRQLLQKYPQNTVVVKNYNNVLILNTAVRHFIGLPIQGNVANIKKAISSFSAYQGSKAHLAILEVFEYWLEGGDKPKNIYQRYDLREIATPEVQWIKALVMAHDAQHVDDLSAAIVVIESDKSILPAFKLLIKHWIEQQVVHFTLQ